MPDLIFKNLSLTFNNINLLSGKCFMSVNISFTSLVISVLSFCISCKSLGQPKEEDKVFHAGPVNSGTGAIYFTLYKENKYQFCDGDFINDGCYSGDYNIKGDTITLSRLKNHNGIPSNQFLIRRYRQMDSSYWQWKYPDRKADWKTMKLTDSLMGSEGDVFPLNQKGEIVFDKNSYFLIRYDKL
jgi:hypothetical protein